MFSEQCRTTAAPLVLKPTARIDLLIASAGDSVESEARMVNSFLGRQMDAPIAIPSDEVDSQPNLERAIAQVLTVQLDRKVLDTGAYYVGCDNARGMDLVAEHIARDDDTDAQPPVFVGAERGRHRRTNVSTASAATSPTLRCCAARLTPVGAWRRPTRCWPA